jgi:hypothetical protein
VDVGVEVLGVRVLEHAESDVTGAAGYVEDSLGLALRRCGAGVERGNKVVSVWLLVHGS